MPVEEWEQMDQPTFADLEFQGKKRKTRRELFLECGDGLIPWQRLEECQGRRDVGSRPSYPSSEGGCLSSRSRRTEPRS